MLVENFIIKENTFIVDLSVVDFITFKLNEENEKEYWLKFHIGNKEARYICDIKELKNILKVWCKLHGKEIEIKNEYLEE